MQDEVLPPEQNNTEALSTITKAEIDMQIATAKRYPRVVSKVKASMLSYATLDEETAQGCFYSLPRGGKNIQGPSIRLAEIAASCFGNMKAGTRPIQTVTTGDTPHVIVQAVAFDIENNTCISIEKRGRIFRKKGKVPGQFRDVDEDDINLAVNRCSAIALRDAIFKIVPLALVKPVMDEAKRVAIGDVKSLSAKREKVVERLKAMGAPIANVLAKVGATRIEDIDLEKLETLIGLGTALKDGETTLEDAFPAPATKAAATTEAPKEKLAEKPTEAKTKTEPPDDIPFDNPAPAPATASEDVSAQVKVLNIARENGFSFTELVEAALQYGWIDQPIATIDQFPAKQAAIFAKTPSRLVGALAEWKGKQ
jgi:hypothetical protein